MDELKIPEIEDPKIIQQCFKVGKSDDKIINDYCKAMNYRKSAFMRVAVLKYIKDNPIPQDKLNG